MNRRVVAVAVACAAVLALAGTVASAEDVVAVNVPFGFVVSGKLMPAGRYELRTQGDDKTALLVQNKATGRAAIVMVVERPAEIGSEQSNVVFEKVGGQRYLAEVRIPDEDGFLVGIAKTPGSQGAVGGSN